MPDRLTIINAALARLGGTILESWDSRIPNAIRVRATYPLVADEVAAAYPWSGLTGRATLTASGAATSGYGYAFSLPSDCLKVRSVDGGGAGGGAVAFKVEGRTLLSDADGPLSLVFTRSIPEFVPEDPDLVAALRDRLTAELAFGQTNSAEAGERWLDAYRKTLARVQAAQPGGGDPEGLSGQSAAVLAIWNRALMHLNLDEVAAFGDPGRAGRRLRQVYPGIRDEVLASYPWNRAMRHAVLIQDTAAPAFGFRLRYLLPDDCLVARDIEKTRYPWKVVGRYLETDAASAKGEVDLPYPGISALDATAGDEDLPDITPPVAAPTARTGYQLGVSYTARIDEADFGPLLSAVVAARLAQAMVGLAPKAIGLAARLDQLYREALRDMRRADAQEAMLEQVERTSSWEDARFS